MTPSRMSFRQHFLPPLGSSPKRASRPLLWLACGLLGACAAAPKPHTAPPVDSTPEAADTAPPEQGTAPPPALLDLAPLQKLAASDPEAVLNQLDDLLAAMPPEQQAEAPFALLYAQSSMSLFAQRQAQGRLDPALAITLCTDAKEWSQRALEQGAAPREAYRTATLAAQGLGELESAWHQADALLDLVEALAVEDSQVAEDLLLVGQVALAWTVDQLQAGEPIPAAARRGATALAMAADAGLAQAYLPLSDLAAWQGMNPEAIGILQAGLLQHPEDAVLYDRLRNLGNQNRARQVQALEAVRREQPGNATVLWYLGEAHYHQGREARTAADTLLASACWDQAEDDFQQAISLREDFRQSCEDWLHLVRTQRAWTLRDEGRIDDAAASLLATFNANPERLEPESSPESLHLAIDAIVADYFRKQDLKSARAFLRQICAIRNDEGNWCNNLGFFCRDLGVAAQAAGEEAKAKELFEESWEAYSRAVELLPEDARVVNDRALIAVYYLDEHLDLAEQELHRAIDLGTAALAEMAPDVPEEEHQYVDMAVGDAWENLAYLYLVRRGEIGDAELYLRQSVQHFPFAERTGVERLRAVLADLRQENP